MHTIQILIEILVTVLHRPYNRWEVSSFFLNPEEEHEGLIEEETVEVLS